VKNEQLLNKLAKQARREQTPSIDVTDDVMAAIAARTAPVNGDSQLALSALAWTAGVAVAITLVVTLLTMPLWRTATGPATEILIAMQI